MQNESGSSGRLKAVLGIVAALIIIGVAFVASGPGIDQPTPEQTAQTAAPAAAPVPAAEEPPLDNTVVLHDTPVPAPATVFKDAADADRTLSQFAGKVLVVNFWATWCAPCIKEMPTLDALQAKLGGADFEVLAISQDREGARIAKPFAEKNEWKNLAFYVEAPGRFMRDAKLNGLPTSLIIDKAGNEVARVEGELDWNSGEVEKVLKDLMAK
jgi:thiol-disulfide isomerase/thioredoxin